MFSGGQLAYKLLFTNLYQQKKLTNTNLFTFLKMGWNQNLVIKIYGISKYFLLRICILSNTCQVYAVNARIRRSFSQSDLWGPLHVLWQVSFGCWVTWSISSWKKCLLSQSCFWMKRFTVIPKKTIWHLAFWQNWCFAQFYHSKIEK